MTTIPSTFGQPSEPQEAPEPEPVRSSRKRTVVVVATVGVVALGVLGGAAALMLSGGEDDVLQAAPAPAVVEPQPEPTTSPVAVAPLPVSAVRSRNIFVPLVEVASVDEDAAEEESEAGGDTPVQDVGAVTSGPSSGVSTGGGIVVGQPVDTAALDALRASEARVAQLETQIADLQTRLEVAGDDSALERELADLQTRYDELRAAADQLADEVEANVIVNMTDVDDQDPVASTLTVQINGDKRVLDLDPATTDVPDTTVMATARSGSDIPLRYISYDGEATPETVTLLIGSSTYTVSVGASLSFVIY